MNTLYYGDNLEILRQHIRDESVDLIYLDPPFNSKATYNLLFKSPNGHSSDAQIEAFDDFWHWGEQAEREFNELLRQPNTDVAELMQALRKFLHENDMMAYLVMMANRLLELQRILKPTGSLYLHCDPTASHYLKVLIDSVFGSDCFQNEIVWQKIRSSKGQTRGFGSVHDIIFAYRKSELSFFRRLFVPLDQRRIEQHYSQIEQGTGRQYMLDNFTQAGAGDSRRFGDRTIAPPPGKHWIWTQERIDSAMEEGRLVFTSDKMVRVKRYLDESRGNPIEDIWTDIPPINSQAAERLGYPTQKPVALLERIIDASSNEGDIVLDPFCGCGTAVHASEKLKRKWIGIDITHLAISLIEKRLHDAFPGIVYDVQGTPKDLAGAQDLANRNKYQFQWWACSLVNAQPYQGKKKGSDSGIDGLIFFQDDTTGAKKIIVSVKGGENVGVSMVRDLKGVMEREKAEIGFFVTLAEPTRPMETEAASAGFYESPAYKDREYPRLQILTIDGLLSGKQRPVFPDVTGGGMMFKRAAREVKGEQLKL